VSDRSERDEFAQKSQLALEALNWSRSRCARELGVDKSVISRWASGGAHPTQHNLTRFTAILQRVHPRFQAGDWRLEAASFEALLRRETPAAEVTSVKVVEKRFREPLLYRGGVVSSAFITACLLPNNTISRGSRFSPRSALRPPHDGFRRRGGTI
jgi:transcriptional regulator with XRE-family HTH domain